MSDHQYDEMLELSFEDEEQNFIHLNSTNNGFAQIPTMVTRCYFMSKNAKMLYSNLLSYMYNGKNECFPRLDRLGAELDMGHNVLNNAIKELEQTGLIEKVKRPNNSNLYRSRKLDSVTVLIHSEMVHALRIQRYKDVQLPFYDALREYRKTELRAHVDGLENPHECFHEVEAWFDDFIYGYGQQGGEDSHEETEEELATAVTEEVTEQNTGTVRKRPLPSTITTANVERQAAPEEPSRKKKGRKDYTEIPVEDWNSHHFFAYFDKLHMENHPAKMPCATTGGDLGAIKTLINTRRDKNMIKKYMEIFFTVKEFQSFRKNILSFVSTNTQSALDQYLNSGSINSYKSSSSKNKLALQADDDWLRENGYID